MFAIGLLSLLALLLDGPARGADPLLRFGSMREVLGMGQHQARVALREIAEREHFFGVGALEALEGEVTVFDSRVLVTAVGPDGNLLPQDPSTLSATLLIGREVSQWQELAFPDADEPLPIDAAVRGLASRMDVDRTAASLFLVEGELVELRAHVIHGACPVHAARSGIELSAEELPSLIERTSLVATVVGIYAENSSGVLTHPGIDVHAHVLFVDSESGREVTAHIEAASVVGGAVLKLPK